MAMFSKVSVSVKYTTLAVSAKHFEDADNSLSGAADYYVERHAELSGYDLDARWESNEREAILIDVPTAILARYYPAEG